MPSEGPDQLTPGLLQQEVGAEEVGVRALAALCQKILKTLGMKENQKVTYDSLTLRPLLSTALRW